MHLLYKWNEAVVYRSNGRAPCIFKPLKLPVKDIHIHCGMLSHGCVAQMKGETLHQNVCHLHPQDVAYTKETMNGMQQHMQGEGGGGSQSAL